LEVFFRGFCGFETTMRYLPDVMQSKNVLLPDKYPEYVDRQNSISFKFFWKKVFYRITFVLPP